MARPARSEHLARLRVALIDIDRPDRRPPVEVWLRTAVGGERDRSAVGMPRDVRDAPVAARDLARPGRPRIDDKEVRPPVAMALLVPSPVGAGDVARDGGLIRARLPAPRDRPGLAGDEAGRVDLGGEREAPAVGRPGDLADRAMPAHLRGSRVGRASEVHDHDRRDRVVVGRVGPDEGERVAVRTQPRPRVPDRPAGQLAGRGDGAPGRQIDREQVADIAVALDRPPHDDGSAPIRGQVELLDDDDAADVFWGHAPVCSHARQTSRAATLPICPSRPRSPTD